jgi:hypothetical protein
LADITTLFDGYAFPEEEEDPDAPVDPGTSTGTGGIVKPEYWVGIRSLEEHPVQVVRP